MKSLLSTSLLFLAATSAGGQAVLTGKAIDRASNTVIAGVVVSGLDSAGQVVTRSVTDLANGYRIVIIPGVAKIQFRRIGYGRVEHAIKDTVDAHLDAVMDRLPTILPPIRSTRQIQCDTHANPEQALAFWEQARSGLTSSIVARESKAAWISTLGYQYQLDGDKQSPRRVVRVELASSPTGIFPAADPEFLASNGYLDLRGGASYIAPDEVALSDETFLDAHCLSLEDLPKGNDSTIGIHFQPAKNRKVVEIEGTLWLRKDPLELKSVEYKYVHVDKMAQRANVGGALNFRTMPNGIAMIESFRIRSTSPRFDPAEAKNPAPQSTTFRINGQVKGDIGTPRAITPVPMMRRELPPVPTETGALIELLQWPGAPPYVADLATVHGVVRDPSTKEIIPKATITFANSPYRGQADSLGAFTMADILPGTYDVYTDDPALDPYGASAPFPPPRQVRAGDNDFGDIDGETPASLVKDNCRQKVMGRLNTPNLGNVALFGLVKQGGSHDVRMEVRPSNAVAGSPPLVFKGKTDPFGRFRACFLPTPSKVWVGVDENRALSGQGQAAFDGSALFQLLPIDLVQKPPY